MYSQQQVHDKGKKQLNDRFAQEKLSKMQSLNFGKRNATRV